MADLITLTEYKTYRNIGSDTKDTQHGALVPIVSEFVENYCNRKFLDYYMSPGITEYFDGKNTKVQLSQFPVNFVDAVYISDDAGLTTEQLSEDASDGRGYVVDYLDGIVHSQNDLLQFISVYSTAYKSLQIDYRAGYADIASIPQDLKLACFSLIEFYDKQEYIPGKALAGANVENIFPDISLPPHIRRILDLYRVL